MTERARDLVAEDLLRMAVAAVRDLAAAPAREDHTTRDGRAKLAAYAAGLADGIENRLVPYPGDDCIPPIRRCYTPSFDDGFAAGRRLRLIIAYAERHGYVVDPGPPPGPGAERAEP